MVLCCAKKKKRSTVSSYRPPPPQRTYKQLEVNDFTLVVNDRITFVNKFEIKVLELTNPEKYPMMIVVTLHSCLFEMLDPRIYHGHITQYYGVLPPGDAIFLMITPRIHPPQLCPDWNHAAPEDRIGYILVCHWKVNDPFKEDDSQFKIKNCEVVGKYVLDEVKDQHVKWGTGRIRFVVNFKGLSDDIIRMVVAGNELEKQKRKEQFDLEKLDRRRKEVMEENQKEEERRKQKNKKKCTIL